MHTGCLLMQNIICIDAYGLFAFFQMQKPGLKIRDLNISSKLKIVYHEFLLKNITLIIPVPELSEGIGPIAVI